MRFIPNPKVGLYGYKYTQELSTGKLVVSLSANISSTANIHDGKMYEILVVSLAGLVENILCDPDMIVNHCIS